MRKLKLFKSLLVVAMLLVGGVSSVWADKTYMSTMTGQLGLTDNTTPAWTYYTKTATIKAGETYTYTFQNYTKGSSAGAEFETWIAEIRENTSGYCLDARGDGGGWTWDGDPSTGTLVYNYTGKAWNEGGRSLADFMTAYNDVTVTLTISCSNDGKVVTIARTATLNGDTDFSGTWTCSNFAGHDKTINLIAEASHIDITKVSYTDASNKTYSTAIESLPYERTWTAGQMSFPFNAGEAVTGTNITAWSKNSTSATTAYAYFDSDPSTNGNQAYSLSENETVTLSFTAYEGWLNTANTATVKLLNSDGVSLAEYEYNVNSSNVTNVKFNGITATGFTNFSGISKYDASKNANGFVGGGKPYLTTANYNPTVTFTVSDNGYVTFTFVSEKAGAQEFNATLPTSGGSAVKMDLASICVVDNITNSDRALGINNLSITSEIAAKYTVTFTYEDNDGNSLSALKANSTTQAVEGTGIESLISTAMQSSFYNGDASIRYDYSTFAADGNATTVPASDISVKLKFAPKEKFVYNVSAVNGSSVKLQEDPIATATAYDGDEPSLTWSKYIKIGGTWYSTTEGTFSITATAAGTKNVVYSASDVDYFFEMENLTRSGGAYLTEETASYSNYSRLRISKGSLHYTPALTGGTYLISIPWENGNSSESEVYVYTRSTGGELSEKLVTFTAPKGSGTFTATITVPDGYSIAFNGNEGGSANNNARMDYMTLISTVSATITSAGWATLYTPYALDFSSFSSNFKAYTATLSENTVTLNEVTTVPANTGVVLKGAANTYNIPVIASSETAKGALKGSATAATAWNGVDGKDLYVLVINNENKAQFTKVGEGSIAAKKAYLPIDKATGARLLSVVFDDGDATGITNATAEMKAEDAIFNLAGQRVAQPANGLYIVNGKKVIVK